MQNPLLPSPSLSSSHRREPPETFDEKTRRFNEYAPLLTRDGRAFDVQEPRVCITFAWERIYLVEMELIERREQYQMPFQVAVRWDAIFGDEAPPNQETLFRLARAVIGAHLESHRTARRLSCQTQNIRLQLPDEPIRSEIHVHNY